MSRPEEILLTKPVWRGDELGHPIPDSMHAVSFALPRWNDVVGYEEKRPEVTERMVGGYPRFVIHPLLRQLTLRICGSRLALPFPSEQAASLAVRFVQDHAQEATLVSRDGAHAVVTNTQDGYDQLKAFWQHTGLIVSTRQAQAMLANRPADQTGNAHRELRGQLARFYRCSEDDIFLAPSGMAAQFAALRVLQQRSPAQATVQLGFPYVDTLKIQQKFGHGSVLLHDLSRIGEDLTELLKKQPIAGCFCEIPGNPMLGSPDMRQVSPILRREKVPLVADDVVATPENVDLSSCADLIATSLTKFVVGSGDAMAGALVCNPGSPFYAEIKAIASAQHQELLWSEDAEVISEHARTFPERMKRHNRNGLFIAEKLRAHPAIEHVYYPKWEFAEAYEAVRKPTGGYGALITFLPRNAEQTSARIYDRMQVCKGPSLGTVFSLACPFTLLAHYTELDWAESCGVSRYLIRISVGLEDPEELWSRLEIALR